MRSAVWFATIKKYNRIADFLIRSGVDVTAPIGTSHTYDHQATLLHLAAASGKLRRVKLLLHHGADVNAKDSQDKSVLHYAVTNNSADITDFLLSSGANVNIRDRQGRSVLHYAILAGSSEVIDILLKNGADLEAADDRGWSPIHVAVLAVSISSTLLMGQGRVSLDARNMSLWRPTRVAIDLTRERIVRNLLDHGANVNFGTKEGHFPLFYAVITGHRNLVKLLITKGANVNIQTTDGETALIAACQRDLVEIVEILLYHQADVNLKSNEGIIALSAIGQNIRTSEVIVRHIVKLEAKKQFVDEDNHKEIRRNEELQRYHDKCKSELEMMRSEKIEESCNMSYYSIISKDLDAIASLARNQKVVTVFEEDEYRDKYPVYAEELKTKFAVATARRNFVHNMENYLKCVIFSDVHLPEIAIEKIVSYLKFEDFNMYDCTLIK